MFENLIRYTSSCQFCMCVYMHTLILKGKSVRVGQSSE